MWAFGFRVLCLGLGEQHLDDPWRQSSNPHRNAANEPWPEKQPQNTQPSWPTAGKGQQNQQGKGPDNAQQGTGPGPAGKGKHDTQSHFKGQDAPQASGDRPPLLPSRFISSAQLRWCGERPYYPNPRNNWCCAYACTRTSCPHGARGLG